MAAQLHLADFFATAMPALDYSAATTADAYQLGSPALAEALAALVMPGCKTATSAGLAL